MNIEEIREYCLRKKGVSESFPFDDKTLVFKVMGKMFALLALEAELPTINLKCKPDEADALREEYSGVKPGYHMNKRLWNTVVCDGSFDEHVFTKWIDNSYDLIVAGLTKKLKNELNDLP